MKRETPRSSAVSLRQTLIAADVTDIMGVCRITNQALSVMPGSCCLRVCVCVLCTLTKCVHSIPLWINSLINTTVISARTSYPSVSNSCASLFCVFVCHSPQCLSFCGSQWEW